MTGEEIDRGWVAITDGLVDAVGRSGDEPEAARTISAAGCLVTPGLVNTHHHMYQNLTRAYAPVTACASAEWWPKLGPLWTRLDEEASYLSTWIGLAELALGGCTTTTDHLYVHPRPNLVDAQIRSATEVGLRFHPVRGSMDKRQKDGNILPDVLIQDIDTILTDSERLIDAYHDDSHGAMIRVALGPCNSFDSSRGLYEATAQLAERRDVRLHTHLAEPEIEETFTIETFGKRPVELFEEFGWGSSRSWVAHAVRLDDADIRRLATWGTGVSHCPSSNMLTGCGIAPVPELTAAGVPVGLGCDGSAATDHASLWLEARTALLLARLRTGPTSMSARDVLALATTGSARCLGREDEIGALGPGYCGDLVAWPLDGPSFAGATTDLVEAWLRCGPVSARHTVVAGRVVVQDGRLTHDDLDERLAAHRKTAMAWRDAAA